MLPHQMLKDLILVFRNILRHGQRFINVKIYISAVFVSHNPFAPAFYQQFHRLCTHNGCVYPILAGGRAAPLHMPQNGSPGLDAGSRLNPFRHAGGVADALGIDDDMMLFPSLTVLDNPVDQLLFIIVIPFRQQNILGAVGDAAFSIKA